MHTLGTRARQAARTVAQASPEVKAQALVQAAAVMRTQQKALLAANAEDLARGEPGAMEASRRDRLLLNPARLEAMASGLETIAALPDPVGEVLAREQRPSGLKIEKRRVPLGVIGVIYEARPNVTADAGGLCLKSGNAVLLRAGSDSFASCEAILACLHQGLRAAGLPEAAIQMVPTRDRTAVGIMLGMTESLDVIVPRGGAALTRRIASESRIPTLQHLDGNCHIYIHASASLALVSRVVHNAKLRRPGICGAVESLVVDAAILEAALPTLLEALPGVEIRGDARACACSGQLVPAAAEDWGREYLAPVLSLKTVDGLAEATAHVNRHSSRHTDAILAEDPEAVAQFQQTVDSAIVMHNTSTQFADGGEFGMGAEIGIATGKLHARGPVGCRELTTYHYRVTSDGAVRA